jgi:hypothetical protein
MIIREDKLIARGWHAAHADGRAIRDQPGARKVFTPNGFHLLPAMGMAGFGLIRMTTV